MCIRTQKPLPKGTAEGGGLGEGLLGPHAHSRGLPQRPDRTGPPKPASCPHAATTHFAPPGVRKEIDDLREPRLWVGPLVRDWIGVFQRTLIFGASRGCNLGRNSKLFKSRILAILGARPDPQNDLFPTLDKIRKLTAIQRAATFTWLQSGRHFQFKFFWLDQTSTTKLFWKWPLRLDKTSTTKWP
jgi:hypothetical protein